MVLFMNISNNSHDRFMKQGTTGLPASFRFTDSEYHLYSDIQ